MRAQAIETGGPSARSKAVQALTDEDVIARVLAGKTSLFEIIMRGYNQRLFRTLLAMVRDDSEAEDILQETYVRAYRHLGPFAGRFRFSTWLTRIAFNEAMARQRRDSRFTSLKDRDQRAGEDNASPISTRPPEDQASSSELRGVLDRAIERMPKSLGVVFMLREVEGLGTDETSECLGISAGSEKVRLHRARSRLRSMVDRQRGMGVRQLYQFAGERYDKIVDGVLGRIQSNGKRRR